MFRLRQTKGVIKVDKRLFNVLSIKIDLLRTVYIGDV